ncbi:MAG: glycosyltransferase family 39 protein [Anaerolineae bacterium]|nr:glycosyltransferase family 39 protein [Anaerolineae bacterium]
MAFALRIYALAAESLWEDEIFTALQASLPFAAMLRQTASDIHPPGYYFLVGAIARLLDWTVAPPSATTDWLWRMPSAFAGVLAVALTWRLAREWLSWEIGLVAALLLTVGPVAVHYSREARMHALFLLFGVLSTWTLTRALRAHRRGWWLAYALATAAGMYTLYMGLALPLVHGFWLLAYLWARARYVAARPVVINFAFSMVLAVALYLPWWPVVWQIIRLRLAGPAGLSASGDVMSLPDFLGQAIGALGPGRDATPWLWFALWLIGLLSIVSGTPGDRNAYRWHLAVLGGLGLVLPLIIAALSGDPRIRHARYAFLLPLYLIFVARGIEGFGQFMARIQKGLARVLFGGAAAGLILLSVFHLREVYRPVRTAWREAATYLTAQTRPGDVIITDALFDTGRYLGYYYRGPAELTTPAVLVATLPGRVEGMRVSGGRVWAVTRFRPHPLPAVRLVEFPGLVISEPVLPVYEVNVLQEAVIELMRQAVIAAPEWSAQMMRHGFMQPDARVTRAAAYLFLGDVLRTAGRLPEAIDAYQAVVADDPAAPGGYVALAEAYAAAGRFEEAVSAYREAVARQPRWQGARAEAAEALARAGEWAAAAAAYRALITP